jgi:hypothetical protein
LDIQRPTKSASSAAAAFWPRYHRWHTLRLGLGQGQRQPLAAPAASRRGPRPFRASARSRPGVFTFTFWTGHYCLFPFSTPLHTPRQHHELARVRSFIMVLVSNSELHLRFKKSMNRAGTTVRMESLVFPSADNLPYLAMPLPCPHFCSSSKRQVK